MLRIKLPTFACTALVLVVALAAPIPAGERFRLSSTTSVDNTGLFSVLLPAFEKETGIRVDVIAVGTGKALKLAENGDVDAVFVHDPESEEKFVSAGLGTDRTLIMANYFLMAGPSEDPAGVASADDITEAFKRIADSGVSFVSRGDASGTHLREQSLWKTARGKVPAGEKWYLESGKGMGETLAIADEKKGYILTDEATFLKMSAKITLAPLYAKKDPLLRNPYSIIAANPAKNPGTDYQSAKKLINFLISPRGQKLIGDFQDRDGNRLFTPAAER